MTQTFFHHGDDLFGTGILLVVFVHEHQDFAGDTAIFDGFTGHVALGGVEKVFVVTDILMGIAEHGGQDHHTANCHHEHQHQSQGLGSSKAVLLLLANDHTDQCHDHCNNVNQLHLCFSFFELGSE